VSDEPVIEMPDGSPGAVADAGASLNRVAGGFETAGQVVARATAQTGAWQGQASVSFHGRAAGYSQALLAVNQALVQARVAVRRYHAQLEHARDRIRALRQREQDAVERLRGARRKLADAKRRLQDAEQRAGAASLSIGSMTGAPDPIGLAEQAAAQRDARDAQDDIDAAGRLIDRVQEEIRELRREAHRRHQDLIEDERGAAAQVRDAAAQLPDIQMPGGASSPSAYAGTAFAGATSAFGAGRNWKGAMERARDEEAKLYTADEFGGGQALDQINDGVRKGTIPPRPPNFDEMSIAQKGRYLYQRTGLHPHEDSPGEAAGKIFTFLSLANPATGAGRLGMSTVARHILPDAVRKASQAFRGKAARGTARLTEHLLARRADDVFPGQTPQKPPGTDTHHVVPKGEYVNRSQDAREALHQAQGKLDDLGIGADDAANGVFLDRDLHRGIHTNKYFEELNERLGKARSRGQAEQALREIAEEARRGEFLPKK